LRLLLDTHIASWSVLAPERIGKAARDLLSDPGNVVCVSDVSLWEIAIKRGLGRKSAESLPASVDHARAVFTDAGFDALPILYGHIRAFGALPPGHGDPFDRLLLAQSLAEPMRLVTHDRHIAAYSDAVILV